VAEWAAAVAARAAAAAWVAEREAQRADIIQTFGEQS
jgi:hypothetical protein